MASDDEHMGVFLELKGAGSRNMEYVLQAQNRDWYSFLNRCLDCGGVIRRFDLAINDMCGLLDIPVLSEKYRNGGAECRCKNYENVQGGKLSGKNRNLASTLYIGSKASTKYFCLYEKQKEQATKKKHTDIINRFEIRLRDKKAVQAVEELLLTYNPHGLVFYLITDFVEFPDYPLWEIFISHDSLPFEMNPVPVNMERTLQWLERQVMPSIVMIEEIDRLTGSNYMKMIDECTHLSEKQEMLVEQMCTDISDVIESEGCFMSNTQDIPVWEKYTLTIEEASKYFRIGENKLRRLAEENKDAGWLIMNGNRIQIKRRQFEKVIDKLDAI